MYTYMHSRIFILTYTLMHFDVCSGCVTSAETVLLKQQVGKFLYNNNPNTFLF